MWIKPQYSFVLPLFHIESLSHLGVLFLGEHYHLMLLLINLEGNYEANVTLSKLFNITLNKS